MNLKRWSSILILLVLSAAPAQAGGIFTTAVNMAVDDGKDTTWGGTSITLTRIGDEGQFNGSWKVNGSFEVSTLTLSGTVFFTDLTTTGTINAAHYDLHGDDWVHHSGNDDYLCYLAHGHVAHRFEDDVVITGDLYVTTNTIYTQGLVVLDASTDLATFTTTLDTYGRIIIDGAADADTQVTFSEDSTARWTIGNNASDNALIFRTGAGAFGTNDRFHFSTNGTLTAISTGNAQFKADYQTGVISTSFKTNSSGYMEIVPTGEKVLISGDLVAEAAFFDDILVEQDAADSLIQARSYSDTADEKGYIAVGHAGGTQDSPTATQSGDTLGVFDFLVFDGGTSWTSGARITAFASQTASAGDAPGYLIISTTPDASSTVVERARYTEDGKYMFGIATAPAIGPFEIAQEGASAPIVSLSYSDSVTHSGALILGRARNTEAAPGPPQSGDTIGVINSVSWNGTSTMNHTGGQIKFEAAANHGDDSTDAPTNMVFRLAPDGSSTLADVLTLFSDTDAVFAKDLDVVADLTGNTIVADTTLGTLAGTITGIYESGAQLDLKHDGSNNMTITVGSGGNPTFAASGALTTFQNVTDGTSGFVITDANGGVPMFNVDTTNERVGFYTTTPDRRVEILDASNPQLRLTQSDGVDFVDFQVDGGGILIVEPSGNGFTIKGDNPVLIFDDDAGGSPYDWSIGGDASGVVLRDITNSVEIFSYDKGTQRFTLVDSMDHTISSSNTLANGGLFRMKNVTNAINAGDVFGVVDWESRDTSDNMAGIVGQIKLIAEANLTANQAKTAMTFHTNTGVAGTLGEGMRLTSDLDLVIGNIFADARLEIVDTSTPQVLVTYTEDVSDLGIGVDANGDGLLSPSGDHLYVFENIGELTGGNGVAFAITDASTTTHFMMAQSATRGLTGSWVYNATPANGAAYLNTLGHSNALHIDASIVNFQNAFAGLASGPTVTVVNNNGGTGAFALLVKGCDETQDAAALIDFVDASDASMGSIGWNATTNSPVLNGSSDIALKDQITTLTRDDRANIMATTLYKFHLKHRPQGTFNTGFIAQNLMKRFPWLVMDRHIERRLDQPRPGLRGYTTVTAVVLTNYPTTHTETTWTSHTLEFYEDDEYTTLTGTITEWTSKTLVFTVDNWTTETEVQDWVIDDVKVIDKMGLIEPMFNMLQQQDRIIERQRTKNQQQDALLQQQAQKIQQQKIRSDAQDARQDVFEARLDAGGL